jgi:hypothetical protein
MPNKKAPKKTFFVMLGCHNPSIKGDYPPTIDNNLSFKGNNPCSNEISDNKPMKKQFTNTHKNIDQFYDPLEDIYPNLNTTLFNMGSINTVHMPNTASSQKNNSLMLSSFMITRILMMISWMTCIQKEFVVYKKSI